MSTGLEFTEEMVGRWRRAGDTIDRLFRFDTRVETPTLPSPRRTVVGDLTGTLTAEGLASGTPISGTLETSSRGRWGIAWKFPGATSVFSAANRRKPRV